MPTIDKYNAAIDDGHAIYNGADNYYGQSFTGDGHAIVAGTFALKKVGSPTGNAVVFIHSETHATAFGTDSVPNGFLAVSAVIDVSLLTTEYVFKNFIFALASQYATVNGTKYTISVAYAGGDASNYIKVAYDSSSPTHAGNAFSGTVTPTWTADAAKDVLFFVHYASTSIASPATTVNDATIGTIDWTDPNNSQISDNSWATANLTGAQTSKYLKATNFGFAIPSGAIIIGIKVEGEGHSNYSAGNWTLDYVKIVKGGTIGSTNKTITTFPYNNDAYRSVGGADELWGETWTPTDINSSDFGVAISTFITSNSYIFYLDHIRITVYYFVPEILTTPITKELEYRAKLLVDIASYGSENSSSDDSVYFRLGASYNTGIAESFNPSRDLPWGKGQFYLKKVGSPTGSVYVKLYSSYIPDDGYVPDTLLATSEALPASSVGTVKAMIDFMVALAEQYDVDHTVTYVLTCEYSGGDASNYLVFGIDNVGGGDGYPGNLVYNWQNTGWVADTTTDACFSFFGIGPEIKAITKIAQYTVKKVNAVTKAAAYTVKKSNVATKGLAYAVKKGVAVTKGLNYAVKTPTAKTKTLSYAVKKNIAITKGLAYSVKKTAAITKGLEYVVQAPSHAVTKDLKYTVKTTHAVTKSAEYRANNKALLASFSETNDEGEVGTPARLGAVYNTAIAESFIPTRSLPLTLSKIYLAKVGNPTGNAYVKLYWSVNEGDGDYPDGGSLAISLPVDVTTIGTTRALIDFIFNGAQRYALSHTVSYDISIEYSGGDASNYLLFGFAGGDIYAGGSLAYIWQDGPWATDLTVDMCFYVYGTGPEVKSDTKSLVYLVKKSNAVTKGLEYSIRTTNTVALTKTLAYRVKKSIALTKGLGYAIKKVVSQTKSLTYAVKKSIGSTKGLQYRVKTTTAKTLAAAYRIKKSHGITKGLEYVCDPTIYNTYNSINPYNDARKFYNGSVVPSKIDLALTYKIKKSIGLSKGLSYTVKKSRSITKDLIYNLVGGSKVKSLGLEYRVRKTFGITKGLDYEIAAENQKTLELKYCVKTSKELTLGQIYRVKTEHEDTKELEYKIVKSTDITKPLQYIIHRVVHEITLPLEYVLSVYPYTDKNDIYERKDPPYHRKADTYSPYPKTN